MNTPKYGLVPFITARQGEDPAPDNLVLHEYARGRYRLRYSDEDAARDRDLHRVLVARCRLTPADESGQPTGEPRWLDMHPHRQIPTMQRMQCQIRGGRARTPLGYIFLAGPEGLAAENGLILTDQPPVCRRHVRAAARLCPHLEGDPVVYLAWSAPMYGVLGVQYGPGAGGVPVVVDRPEGAVPYGDERLDTFLASQLVRRLSCYEVLSLEELLHRLKAVPSTGAEGCQ